MADDEHPDEVWDSGGDVHVGDGLSSLPRDLLLEILQCNELAIDCVSGAGEGEGWGLGGRVLAIDCVVEARFVLCEDSVGHPRQTLHSTPPADPPL
jgi:hypothetical protein